MGIQDRGNLLSVYFRTWKYIVRRQYSCGDRFQQCVLAALSYYSLVVFVIILGKIVTLLFFKFTFRMEEQSICSYLEKILSKNMELMEKKLVDYIDQRIYKLQEHIDNKIALLVDLLQSPNSPPSGMPLRHFDSGERLSNGER